MTACSRRRQAGFTVIELIVVVAILAILIALALPRVKELTDSSKRVAAKADLVVIRTALERYQVDYGYYPVQLGVLRDAGYVAAEVTFRDPWGSYYFYAVDDNKGKPAAYALSYAGAYPSASGRLADSWGTGRDRIPAGKDPTGAKAWTFSNCSACTWKLADADGNTIARSSLRGYWQSTDGVADRDQHPFYTE